DIAFVDSDVDDDLGNVARRFAHKRLCCIVGCIESLDAGQPADDVCGNRCGCEKERASEGQAQNHVGARIPHDGPSFSFGTRTLCAVVVPPDGKLRPAGTIAARQIRWVLSVPRSSSARWVAVEIALAFASSPSSLLSRPFFTSPRTNFRIFHDRPLPHLDS